MCQFRQMIASYQGARAPHSKFYHAKAKSPDWLYHGLAWQTRQQNHPRQGRFLILQGLFPDNRQACQAGLQYPSHLCVLSALLLYALHHVPLLLQMLWQPLCVLLLDVLQTIAPTHQTQLIPQSGAPLMKQAYLWFEMRISDLAPSQTQLRSILHDNPRQIGPAFLFSRYLSLSHRY